MQLNNETFRWNFGKEKFFIDGIVSYEIILPIIEETLLSYLVAWVLTVIFVL